MVAAHPARTKILLRQSLGDAPSGPPPPNDSERLLRLVVQFIRDGQEAQIFAAIDPMALVLSVVGMVAFFFTSAPVIAPSWLRHPTIPVSVERVKQHVIEVVERCLTAVSGRSRSARLGRDDRCAGEPADVRATALLLTAHRRSEHAKENCTCNARR